MIDSIIKYFISRMDAGGVSLIIISMGAIYIWYQHNSKKLLKEEIELEKKKRKEFLNDNMSDHLIIKSRGQSFRISKNILDVLCVDDEALVRNLVAKSINDQDSNVRIDTAADGEEALLKCAEHPPAVLITDIVMPKMNGIDLINNLREKHKDIPIIIISGYASSDDIEAYGIKINDNTIFLRKPFRAEELISTLKRLADKLNNGV